MCFLTEHRAPAGCQKYYTMPAGKVKDEPWESHAADVCCLMPADCTKQQVLFFCQTACNCLICRNQPLFPVKIRAKLSNRRLQEKRARPAIAKFEEVIAYERLSCQCD